MTRKYNCIAWAAGDDRRWWWPTGFAFWPDGVPSTETLDAFVSAFQTLGYEVCQTGDLESGQEKIAIYTSLMGLPTHASRQLPTGMWTSKLGPHHDIEHELEGVSASEYGHIARFMARQARRG